MASQSSSTGRMGVHGAWLLISPFDGGAAPVAATGVVLARSRTRSAIGGWLVLAALVLVCAAFTVLPLALGSRRLARWEPSD